jgi:hypothetical protein
LPRAHQAKMILKQILIKNKVFNKTKIISGNRNYLYNGASFKFVVPGKVIGTMDSNID